MSSDPRPTHFLTKSQLEELHYSPQRQNAIKNEAKHCQGRAKCVLEVYGLHKQDVLGSHACHCHLSELHLARETRVGNAVEKVNRWARERASVGPEVQRPPRGSAWVWQGMRKVGLGRVEKEVSVERI